MKAALPYFYKKLNDGSFIIGSQLVSGQPHFQCDTYIPEDDLEFMCRASNAHEDLVKQLTSLLGYADAMHRADAHQEDRVIDYITFPEARAALAKAGAV